MPTQLIDIGLTPLNRHRRTIQYVEFLCEVNDWFCLFFRHMFHPRSSEAASPHCSVLIDKKETDEVRRDELTPYVLFKCVSV